MYQNIQALNKASRLKLNKNAGYLFASEENFCPVFYQELPQVIREYFICFPNNGTDLPHAILGFQEGKNRYVNESGKWQAVYIPAYIRRYPFILARSGNATTTKDEFTLAVDADAPHLGSGAGEPLFTAKGTPSETLQGRIELLQAIENQRKISQKATREIDQAGLFRMQELSVMAGDQKVAAISGLRMIDEEKLKDTNLKPGPALEIIYAHLFSRASLRYGVLAEGVKPELKAADVMAALSFEDDIIRFD